MVFYSQSVIELSLSYLCTVAFISPVRLVRTVVEHSSGSICRKLIPSDTSTVTITSPPPPFFLICGRVPERSAVNWI